MWEILFKNVCFLIFFLQYKNIFSIKKKKNKITLFYFSDDDDEATACLLFSEVFIVD